MSHTLDDLTEASTPGEIQISSSKYLDYLGLTGFVRLFYQVLFHLPQSLVFNLFHSDKIIYDYIQKAEQFKHGCLNPSIVINKDKGIIATFTNLSKNLEKNTPVIKIHKEPLELICNIEVTNGQKLPTVAIYFRGEQDAFDSAWADFSPKIANCFTNDLNECNKLLSRVSDVGWQCLEKGLRQLSNAEEIGLYHIIIEDELLRKTY